MNLYLYEKCSTCQKALRFLGGRQISFTRKEITLTPPTVSELRAMLRFQEGNLKKLFNTSGNLYREFSLSEKMKTMPESEALELLHRHGMLVKRPFLIASDFGLTGFNEAVWAKKFGEK